MYYGEYKFLALKDIEKMGACHRGQYEFVRIYQTQAFTGVLVADYQLKRIREGALIEWLAGVVNAEEYRTAFHAYCEKRRDIQNECWTAYEEKKLLRRNYNAFLRACRKIILTWGKQPPTEAEERRYGW